MVGKYFALANYSILVYFLAAVMLGKTLKVLKILIKDVFMITHCLNKNQLVDSFELINKSNKKIFIGIGEYK